MAFFGITYLGYQNPFADRMLESAQNKLDIRAPKDLYRVPVTENQQYGWWIPNGGLKNQEPWTQTRRFPRNNSEMTKFVNEMSVTNPDFSLF